MGLPQLNTCCFIFDLKTGNIIIGSINAFFSFVLTVIMIVTAATMGTLDRNDEDLDINEQAAITGIYVMSIILVLMFLTKFLFDVAFVYAVVKERAGMIKAYLIMWIVFTILSIFVFFLNAHGYGAGTICTEVLYMGINIYAILLCRSYYKQLNSREEV